jgi:hypothetical protein
MLIIRSSRQSWLSDESLMPAISSGDGNSKDWKIRDPINLASAPKSHGGDAIDGP